MVRAIDLDALKKYIKKTDLTAVERGALLQAISNMPTLTPPNEPLTWNELGNMVEKPVYIVELEDGESCWVLVHTVDDIKALFVSAFDQYDYDFNPRTPRGVRQQTLLKSREFAWLNLLICTRGRRLSIQKQTRLCSIKLSFMLFGCEPAGEGVSSWTSHAIKSKVRLEGRSAYSQSVRFSAHSDFPGNKSGGCPVRDP